MGGPAYLVRYDPPYKAGATVETHGTFFLQLSDPYATLVATTRERVQMFIYFAKDGSFGDADGLVVLDTRTWSDGDWQQVENASDYSRAAEAVQVGRRNGTEL